MAPDTHGPVPADSRSATLMIVGALTLAVMGWLVWSKASPVSGEARAVVEADAVRPSQRAPRSGTIGPTHSAPPARQSLPALSVEQEPEPDLAALLADPDRALDALMYGRISREEFTESEWLAVVIAAAGRVILEGSKVSDRAATFDRISGLPGLDAMWSRPEFDLEPATRDGLERLVAPYRERLQDETMMALSEVDALAAVQWERGEVDVRPAAEVAPAPAEAIAGAERGLFRYSSAIQMGGYQVDFHFDSSRFPELQARFRTIEHLKSEAEAAIISYLDVHAPDARTGRGGGAPGR